MNFVKRLSRSVRSVPTTSEIRVNEYEQKLIEFLDMLESWIAEFPPGTFVLWMLPSYRRWLNWLFSVDMGAQRYGNKAFAKWHAKLLGVGSKLSFGYSQSSQFVRYVSLFNFRN